MVKKILSNPQNFCEEAVKLDVRYEYLIEAKLGIGCQKLAEMFEGKSLRGKESSLTSSIINQWIDAFEFVRENPDKENEDASLLRR